MKHISFFKYLFALGVISTAFSTSAVPAKPGWRTVAQPDGTEIKVRVVGDERGHYLLDENSRILYQKDNGIYYYAKFDQANRLTASDIEVRPQALLSDSENATLASINYASIAAELNNRISTKKEKNGNAPAAIQAKTRGMQKMVTAKDPDFRMLMTNYPSTGSPKALVILVNFKDVKFTVADPKKFFNDMLNQEGYNQNGHIGSVSDYFKKCSMGQFTPQFDVYGPVDLPNNMKYYGENYPTVFDDDRRAEEVIIDACKLLDNEINFADYDTDNDGIIDNVYVFYAGYGEADGGSADTIWPHAWNVYYGAGKTLYLDGKLLDHYAMSNELDNGRGTSPAGIGTFTHEFSHVMGLPDLYDIYYSDNTFTPGSWNILDVGSYNGDSKVPPLYSAFERFSLGWIKPQQFKSATGMELEPLADSNNCYIAYGINPNEFFLFEYRKQEGFDRYIPNSGMLVHHIDYVKTVWEMNECNTDPDHQYVDIVEADNTQSEYSRGGDCFPGTAFVRDFDATSRPAFVDWYDNPLGISINNIKLTGGKLTMDVEAPNTGVSSVVDDYKLNILISGRTITSASSSNVEIYDMLGRKIATLAPASSTEMPASGIYVAKTANNLHKFILK